MYGACVDDGNVMVHVHVHVVAMAMMMPYGVCQR